MAEYLVEATKSRSGKHAARRILIVHERDGGVRIVSNPSVGESARGTYARGAAGRVVLHPGSYRYAVWAQLIMGPRLRVVGRFDVIDSKGNIVLRAVLRKRKLRRSCGDEKLWWLVEDAVQRLGLAGYVRRSNMLTGTRGRCEQK